MRKKKKNQAPIPILVERETRHAVDYYECNSVSEDGEKKRKDLHCQEQLCESLSQVHKKKKEREVHTFFLSMRKRQIVRHAIDQKCNTFDSENVNGEKK